MRIASIHRRACTLATIVAAVLLLASGAAAQVVLDGRYSGTGPAEGATLDIAPDVEGFAGALAMGGEPAQSFLADRRVDMAEAIVEVAGRVTLLQVLPQPFGAEVALIPIEPDGRPDLEDGRVLQFLREGERAVRYPEGYAFPPRSGRGRIAAQAFLVSYVYWRPPSVATGYASLAPRHRTLIRLFPAVQLDLAWRLCSAPGADQAVAMALRGESLDCRSVVDGLYAAQRAGRYAAFRSEVEEAAATLRTQVRCADGYVMDDAACARVARKLAEAASNLETAAAVLARYR